MTSKVPPEHRLVYFLWVSRARRAALDTLEPVSWLVRSEEVAPSDG